MEEKVIALHAQDISKVSKIVADSQFDWLYLGQSIIQQENISQVLGKQNRYFIGNLLQEVARQEKQSFLNFIAQLGFQQKNQLHWWASNIAFKSPYASNLFLLWCYAAVFDKVYSENEGGGRLFLVLVEDRWLYRYLWENYSENSNIVHFPSRTHTIPEMAKLAIKGLAARAHFLLKATYHSWQAKSITRNSNIEKSNGQENQIYIFSWIEDRFFKTNGFEDVYFGNLAEIARHWGVEIDYITPPFLSFGMKKQCSEYEHYKFVLLDRYISFSNIVISAFRSFKISLPENMNDNLFSRRTLLQRESAYEFSSFPHKILYYQAFKGLLNRIQRDNIIIIYPFENQHWDKMLCTAAKESDKSVQLIAYQHSTIPSLLLCYFLGDGEHDTMPLPNLIVTNSEYTTDVLKNAGYGEIPIVNGGAIRYKYLDRIESRTSRKNETAKTVLVALPGLRPLAEELIVTLLNAFDKLEGNGIRFIFKFHPDTPRKKLKIKARKWPDHFKETNTPIAEVMKEVDLVIYSSSTVGLEALIKGISVIKYCSEHILDLDPLGDLAQSAVRGCSENELEQAVLSAIGNDPNYMTQDHNLGVDISNKLFSPVNEEVWKQILNSGNICS